MQPGLFGATLTLTNSGDTALSLTAVEATSPFTLQQPFEAPSALAPGESAELVVGFLPAGQGEVNGVVRILSDDPALPVATVPLGVLGLGEAGLTASGR